MFENIKCCKESETTFQFYIKHSGRPDIKRRRHQNNVFVTFFNRSFFEMAQILPQLRTVCGKTFGTSSS